MVLAGHFAKGNPLAKETIERISGSGVFARDPDSLVTFTKHEEERAFTVEMTLRNLPPVDPFVVRWDWPLFRRDDVLDPTRLKPALGRPPTHTAETLLECLGDQRLSSDEWRQQAAEDFGVTRAPFFRLQKQLKDAQKVVKSQVDHKWERIQEKSRNWYEDKDQ